MSDYGVGALGGVVLIDPETGLPYRASGGSGGANLKNFTGQVRVDYSSLTLVNFDSGVNKDFNIGAGAPYIHPSPTTKWPYGNGIAYDPDFFNSVTGKLRENNKPGQQHEWRLIGTFANKGAGNNGALIIELYNPDSGFVINESVTMPSSTTAGVWSVDIITIADSNSLDTGRGYNLRARTTFNDANYTCDITSILRVSRATENEVA